MQNEKADKRLDDEEQKAFFKAAYIWSVIEELADDYVIGIETLYKNCKKHFTSKDDFWQSLCDMVDRECIEIHISPRMNAQFIIIDPNQFSRDMYISTFEYLWEGGKKYGKSNRPDGRERKR